MLLYAIIIVIYQEHVQIGRKDAVLTRNRGSDWDTGANQQRDLRPKF